MITIFAECISCQLLHFTGRYLSFDIIYIMDYLSRTCLGFLIFLEILTVLKRLTFNYHVYLMRMTLNLAGQEMLSCTFVISILITAYASFQYLTLGPYVSLFKEMISSYITSIRIATAYVKMKIFLETNISDTALNKLMFVCFFFIVTLTMMNILISIINNAIESVKTEKVSTSTKRKIYDSELNEFFWKKINQAFQCIRTDRSDVYLKGSTNMARKYNIKIKLFLQKKYLEWLNQRALFLTYFESRSNDILTRIKTRDPCLL